MATAIDDRPEKTPGGTDPGIWIEWAVRALGTAAGIPVTFLLVVWFYGDDITAGNERAAIKDVAVVKAWEAEAAKDAAEQARYEAERGMYDQYRLQSFEITRSAKVAADKAEAGP